MESVAKDLKVDDSTLAYKVYPREGAPVVVLIHGLASTKESYDRMVPFLADSFHLITLDQRGHGESSQVGPYTFDRLVEDLRAVLEAEQIERATLVGGSFASVPVQMFAARYPERTAGLVLLDGGFFRPTDLPGYDLQAMQSRPPYSTATMDEMIEGVMRGYGPYADEFVREQTRREVAQKEDGRVYLALPHEAFVAYLTEYATVDLPALTAAFTAPVLVLLADSASRPAGREAFYEKALEAYLASVRDGQAATVPDSLHAMMVTHPKETADQVRRFVLENR